MDKVWLGVVGAVLAMLAAPLLAQDAPVEPRIYGNEALQRDPSRGDPRIAARLRASADAAERRCKAGSGPDCTSLGQSFREGAGRPKNRRVAELVLREACQLGDAEGCSQLADLMQGGSNRSDDPERGAFRGRACALGKHEDCPDYARQIEAGVFGLRDLPAADAVRRKACAAAGEGAACRDLAWSLSRLRRAPERRAEGIALYERLCTAGDAAACGEASGAVRTEEENGSIRARELAVRGCELGDKDTCRALAQTLLASPDRVAYGTGKAEARAYADKLCTSGSTYDCLTFKPLLEEPALLARCEGGERDDCVTLLRSYRSKGGMLEDRGGAQAIAARICETSTFLADRRFLCHDAARAVLEDTALDRPIDPARLARLLERACEAGNVDACLDLARELADGRHLPLDTARADAMLSERCEAKVEMACTMLGERIGRDPAARLAEAGDGYGAPLGEGAPEEPASAVPPTTARQDPDDCTVSTASWRGRKYADTICLARIGVTGGTPVLAGTAPFQALLWRPTMIGKARVHPGYRVKCGGTVVRTGWILTAAHCTEDLGLDIAKAGLRVRIGVSNPYDEREGYSYPILRTIRHSAYVGEKDDFRFDVALVQYDPGKAVPGARPAFPVRSIRLDTRPPREPPIAPGSTAFVFGWGYTRVQGSVAPTVLLRGRLALRSEDACNEAGSYVGAARDSVLCADGVNGQQACTGDSGGPLVAYEPGSEGLDRPVLIGVVSSGVKCGTKGKPSRFIRLGHPSVQAFLAQNLPGYAAMMTAP